MSPDAQILAEYELRIRQALEELGIPVSYATERRQLVYLEGRDLVSIGLDLAGREQRMERQAAARWQAMRDSAANSGITLAVVSAFRSFDYQKRIIARKLAAGQTL